MCVSIPSTWKNYHNFFFDLNLLFCVCVCYVRNSFLRFLQAPNFCTYLDETKKRIHHFKDPNLLSYKLQEQIYL